MPSSSRGLGHLPFTEVTGVRIPLGVNFFRRCAMPELQYANTETYQKLAQQLRIDSIRSTTEAGSGHPSSSMSAADLMAVLLAKFLKYDFNNSQAPNNDRLIFSKGHAAPLLYSMYKTAGAITDAELLT